MAVWLVQIQEPVFEDEGGEWRTIEEFDCSMPYGMEMGEVRTIYALKKALDGSDADAMRVVRADSLWRHEEKVHTVRTKEQLS